MPCLPDWQPLPAWPPEAKLAEIQKHVNECGLHRRGANAKWNHHLYPHPAFSHRDPLSHPPTLHPATKPTICLPHNTAPSHAVPPHAAPGHPGSLPTTPHLPPIRRHAATQAPALPHRTSRPSDTTPAHTNIHTVARIAAGTTPAVTCRMTSPLRASA
eukprot:303476-Chlamydomonas_euryale.AAC.1